MGSGDRRAAVLMSSVVLLVPLVVGVPTAQAAVSPSDCTVFPVKGTATGTSGDDVICGTSGADVIRGYGGNDTIFGLGGDDYIDAGSGADAVQGNDGADEILLGSGNDVGSGGPGADRLFGQDGDDTVLGHSGDDALVGGAGVDSLNGGYGVDYCRKDGADTLVSCFYDTSLPQVSWISVRTPAVDTSAAPAVVTVRTRITDPGTGLEWLRYGFTFKKPDGAWADQPVAVLHGLPDASAPGCTSDGHASAPAPGTPTVCRVSGSAQDGVYELKLLLPRWTRKGTFVLTGISLRDSAGNQRDIGAARIAERDLDVRFAQIGTGDPYAPRIRDIRVVTPTLDTSGAARVLVVRAHLTDNLSGVAEATLLWARYSYDSTGRRIGFRDPRLVGFVLESDPKTCPGTTPTVEELLSADRVASCRESGTRTDGWYRLWTVVPRWTGQGTYHLVDAGVDDRAGNTESLYWNEIPEAGLSRSFKQAGTGDEAAPTVSSVEVMTPSVDSGTEAVRVDVRIRVKDGVSGMSDVRLYFGAPGQSLQYVDVWAGDTDCGIWEESCRLSGSDNDGVYRATGWLPAHAAAGTWTLRRIDVNDKAGNGRTYRASDGLTASFTNG